MPITDWPLTERPREKLMNQGAKSLSDAELLAIFLRTGVKGKTAVDVARSLIHKFQSLRLVFEADKDTFCEQPGLGQAKYVQFQACLEIGRRYLYAGLNKPRAMAALNEIIEFLVSQMRHQTREIFSALFLNKQFCVIAYEELFMGSLHEVVVHPRELIKKALQHNSAYTVVAHNHPSGSTLPSKADKTLTKALKSALSSVDVVLLDHMIIGEEKVFSFSEEGLL